MNNNSSHRISGLRFRRWSRAGYAVFCSLACSVSIGFLSVSVSSTFIKKSVTCSTSVLSRGMSESDNPDTDCDLNLAEVALQQQSEILCIVTSSDLTAAGWNRNIYIVNSRVEVD